MDKEKSLLRLSQEIDTFKAHVNRLKPAGYVIHPLDLELLRKKVAELYDLVLQFDIIPTQLADNVKETIPVHTVTPEKIRIESLPEIVLEKEPVLVPKPEIVEPAEVKMALVEDVFIADEKEVVNSPLISFQKSTPVVEKVEEEIYPSVTPEVKPVEIIPEVAPEPVPKISHPKPEPVKTTLDLFSTSDSSIANKLTHLGSDTSLAGKMQKEPLLNIRSAIGINDKFLFVNELFRGDLSRYNRVMDELNVMKTKQGADTYLIELKIEGQWHEDNGAFQKLKEIVARKY